MKAVIFNLGCKVNQYECDVLSESLQKRGFAVSLELGHADLYIINTCAVTKEAEKKSRQAIARCKKFNENCNIIVCGCASQKDAESFAKDKVIYVSGVADKLKILDIVDKNYLPDKIINIGKLPLTCETTGLSRVGRGRAFVKIQDGCNNFCSYCIIPYLRGRSRSRAVQDIVSEVKSLAHSTKEVVLTGINMSQYGQDIDSDLATLISALKDVDVRIRLGSFYVEAINRQLLEALFSLKHFCPHFHLSLQSGDDAVLKDMNRKYTTADYLQAIKLIRSFDSNASITTDIIVGFPTETKESFMRTAEFISKVGFSDIHIFPYSMREGTVSAKYKDLPPQIVKERKNLLTELKKQLINNYLLKNIGKTQNMLAESKEGEYFVGYSDYYIRMYTKRAGGIMPITPTQIFKDGLKE